ncbi:hypothetical protein OYC44_24455 [Escherichia coli]|nr:hypothetical protein [Escherichia coli]MCY6627443.1 hypothetical protein [Escherichia coli]MCY6636841.1 hypothetical protein [Escherichia coli]
MSQPNPLCVGIDVSKTTLDIATANNEFAQLRIPLYSITDWHRSPISDSHPFDQPGT